MDKRALCAFDNKRILLEDGIHTLAIGHKAVTGKVEQDRIENPRADEVFPEKLARDMGLLWTRRKGATKRAGIDLTVRREENDDVAIAAGHAAQNNIRQMVNQIPDFPDRYNPLDQRNAKPTKQKSHANHSECQAKRQRVEIISDSDEESTQSSSSLQNLRHQPQPNVHFQRGLARIDSQASEAAPLSSSPTPTPARRRQRNSLVDDEAGEGGPSDCESDSHGTGSIAHADHTSHSPSDSDADSSDSDLDFVVGNDCFE